MRERYRGKKGDRQTDWLTKCQPARQGGSHTDLIRVKEMNKMVKGNSNTEDNEFI